MAESQVLNTEQTQRSLWLGDLPPWVDEAFLFNLFVATNQLVSVKLIRNRTTGLSEGYAFLEFRTHEAADQILRTYNGTPIPGTDLVFRLNWAAYGVGKTQPAGEDHSLFVGDLAPDISDSILMEYFRQFYPSVRSAKVITDATTGRSKGYGFVRFAAEAERDRALNEMNGHFLSNRPIRVSLATAKKSTSSTTLATQIPHPSDFDPTNTTLFIGGLSSSVTEEQLRAVFGRFGDIIYVKIPQGKGCGFVQFVLRASAERAINTMNGQMLGGSAIRISWGRSSSRATNQGGGLPQFAGLPGHPGFGGPGGFDAQQFMPGGFNPAMAGMQQMAGMGLPGGMLGPEGYISFGGPGGPQAAELYNAQAYHQAAAAGLLPPNSSMSSSQTSAGFGSNGTLGAAIQVQATQQQMNGHGTSPRSAAGQQQGGAQQAQQNGSSSNPSRNSSADSPTHDVQAQTAPEPVVAVKAAAVASGKNGVSLLGAHLFASLLA